MDRQMEKQRQGRADAGRVPARWQGRQLGGGDRCLAGGTSFGRLRHNTRTRYASGPLSALRPILGKPKHRPLKSAGREISAGRNIVEFGTSVQRERGNALSPYATCIGEDIGNDNDLLS